MSAREKTFREELDTLIEEGNLLFLGILFQKNPDRIQKLFSENNQKKYSNIIKSLLDFKLKYETWYSKSYKVIKITLPDRLTDFASAYKKPLRQKELTIISYSIQDFILGINIVGTDSNDLVSNLFLQQLNILKTAKEMLSSKLLDLKALLQADLFDSEINAANELAKKGFLAAAGAICGVIIEKHLHSLCERHNITITKKNPGINDLCVILRSNDIIDVPQERFIMSCADIRNICDHYKKIEVTQTQIDNLLSDTKRIIDTIY